MIVHFTVLYGTVDKDDDIVDIVDTVDTVDTVETMSK